MAFPSSTGSRQQNLDAAWNSVRSAVTSLKASASAIRTATAINSQDLINLLRTCASVRKSIYDASQLTGIQAYVRTQLGDPTLDLVGEANALITALDAVTSWIGSNFPKNPANYLLNTTMDGNGNLTYRTFSPTELAPLMPLLDDLLARID
jgi:hypothetical protein